jgi:hypothetical protein
MWKVVQRHVAMRSAIRKAAQSTQGAGSSSPIRGIPAEHDGDAELRHEWMVVQAANRALGWLGAQRIYTVEQLLVPPSGQLLDWQLLPNQRTASTDYQALCGMLKRVTSPLDRQQWSRASGTTGPTPLGLRSLDTWFPPTPHPCQAEREPVSDPAPSPTLG